MSLLKNQNAYRSLVQKCLKCHRTKSKTWTKCPHCMYESFISPSESKAHHGIVNRIIQKSNSDEDWEYEDSQNHNSKQEIVPKEGQIEEQHSGLKKFQGGQAFYQKIMKQESNQQINNYNIDGQIGKFILLFILFSIFLFTMYQDLQKLKQEDMEKASIESNLCSDKFQQNNCKLILGTLQAEPTWKKGCAEWQICMNKDPSESVKIVKIMSQYLTEIMNSSLSTFNSQIIGAFLFIYFGGLCIWYLLSWVCPRRK